MYIDYSTLGKILHASYRPSALTWRRLLWTNTTLSVYGATQVVNYMSDALDRVLHPDIAECAVEAPVYITAPPRSGTTYLHRLMSLDPRFTTLKLYQTLLPSVTTERAVAALRNRSSDFPVLSQLRSKIDHLFDGWESQHHVGLDDDEEDEAFWVMALATPALWIMFPFPEELRSLTTIDDWPEERRKKLSAHIRRCLQAHMYSAAEPGQTLLAKSVLLSSRFKTLLDATPDARFIQLVRHPYEALPSAISMLTAPWKTYCPEIPEDSAPYQAWSDLFIDFYLRLHRELSELPEERVVTIAYSDLLRQPREQIDRIYRHFGWELTPEYAARLDAEVHQAKNFRSKHRYSLQQYGLNREHIHTRLAEIFDAYHFTP